MIQSWAALSGANKAGIVSVFFLLLGVVEEVGHFNIRADMGMVSLAIGGLCLVISLALAYFPPGDR